MLPTAERFAVYLGAAIVLIHTAAVTLGLAALLRASPRAFAAVTYAGAIYLVSLGLSTLLGRRGGLDVGTDRTADGGASRAYLRGIAVNVLNPKVALFFLAFLPGFAPGGAPVAMLSLGAAYAALTACYLGGVGALSGAAAGFLGRDPRVARALDRAAGIALVGLGGAIVVGHPP